MLDAQFLRAVAALKAPDLGTENVAWLLYSILRMTRPRRVLEIGLGYTTPFLLRALADNKEEFDKDRCQLRDRVAGDSRLEVLLPEYYSQPYEPRLIAVDDYSDEDSTAHLVREVIRSMDLDGYWTLHRRTFEGLSQQLDSTEVPLDFVWFDCGGPAEYIDFLREYWSMVNPNGGLLLLHYTYWHLPTVYRRMNGAMANEAERAQENIRPTVVLNEIKRQQAEQGLEARFEVCSLVEPHKSRQGSVTMVRRLPEATRDVDPSEELGRLGFGGPFPEFELS